MKGWGYREHLGRREMSSLGIECILDCRVVHGITMAIGAIRREERMVKGVLKEAKGKLQIYPGVGIPRAVSFSFFHS